jgi:hypothetical protein
MVAAPCWMVAAALNALLDVLHRTVSAKTISKESRLPVGHGSAGSGSTAATSTLHGCSESMVYWEQNELTAGAVETDTCVTLNDLHQYLRVEALCTQSFKKLRNTQHTPTLRCCDLQTAWKFRAM